MAIEDPYSGMETGDNELARLLSLQTNLFLHYEWDGQVGQDIDYARGDLGVYAATQAAAGAIITLTRHLAPENDQEVIEGLKITSAKLDKSHRVAAQRVAHTWDRLVSHIVVSETGVPVSAEIFSPRKRVTQRIS